MAQLANVMALDALHIAGLVEMRAALTVPLCTGMSLSLVLLGLRLKWKSPPVGARFENPRRPGASNPLLVRSSGLSCGAASTRRAV